MRHSGRARIDESGGGERGREGGREGGRGGGRVGGREGGREGGIEGREGGREGGRKRKCLLTLEMFHYTVNLSNPDTVGTEESVQISEVS